MNKKAWEALSRRRASLIMKELRRGRLSKAEQRELERLQGLSEEYLNIVAPPPEA
jgi:hypothetical protein